MQKSIAKWSENTVCLGLVASLGKSLLDAVEQVVNVTSLLVVDNGDTHVADTEVLVLDLLVQTGSHDNVLGHQLRQQIGRLQALRVAHRCHAVSTVLLAVSRKLGEFYRLNLIHLERRTVRVVDAAELARIAGGQGA